MSVIYLESSSHSTATSEKKHYNVIFGQNINFIVCTCMARARMHLWGAPTPYMFWHWLSNHMPGHVTLDRKRNALQRFMCQSVFSWLSPARALCTPITLTKLPSMECYHIFSNTRGVHLAKNHNENLPPNWYRLTLLAHGLYTIVIRSGLYMGDILFCLGLSFFVFYMTYLNMKWISFGSGGPQKSVQGAFVLKSV